MKQTWLRTDINLVLGEDKKREKHYVERTKALTNGT